ncbi:class I SAM-dependent methyltransferase [Myxococcus sp. RHSTA-1-4]|uniref:class I SAM-dependent methyltransferase n=1 Tax=Myxococcus sp. RHSTA-1-4 TaxID=2874601 RepID=UPI001CBFD0AA|nr:class I SAM-dependent methyltransferase [Myxococcus sp. RHSTA-1-4]MBZ4416513.1 methyltransferase domain-containing protein [Myxococcus sp. RHSTA-1-4]
MSTATVPQPQSISSRYDQVSSTYNASNYTKAAHKLFWVVYEHLTWKAVEKVLPPAGTVWRVLDAGGGGGKFSARFAEAGHQVTVLDISAGMLDAAKAHLSSKGLLERATFIEGTVAELPFEDASFDLVFSEGDPVSYCLDQYPKAMSELVRVVKPRGPVIMGVDNRHEHFMFELKHGKKAEALKMLLTGRGKCPYGLPVHLFTLKELHDGVTAAGAEVEEIFGKPVMYFEMLEAMQAERGPDFDVWAARDEIIALQEKFAHEGFALQGQHFQVMARRK